MITPELAILLFMLGSVFISFVGIAGYQLTEEIAEDKAIKKSGYSSRYAFWASGQVGNFTYRDLTKELKPFSLRRGGLSKSLPDVMLNKYSRWDWADPKEVKGVLENLDVSHLKSIHHILSEDNLEKMMNTDDYTENDYTLLFETYKSELDSTLQGWISECQKQIEKEALDENKHLALSNTFDRIERKSVYTEEALEELRS